MGAWLWLALAAVPVEVTAEPCVGVDAAEVQRIAQIELGQGADPKAPVVARLSCAGTEVEVAVDDPVTRKSLARRIALGAVDAKARDRTAALALAELVAASWSELLLPPLKVAPAQPPVLTREQATSLEPVQVRRVRLSAHATGRWLPAQGLLQGGAELEAIYLPSAHLGLALDFGGEHGSVQRSLGRLDVDSLGGAARVFASWSLDEVGLLAGVGIRGGGARVTGMSPDPRVLAASVSGAWLGPALAAQLSFGGPRLLGSIGLEAGWSVISVRGTVNGGGGAGIDGGWLTLTLGLEVRP